MMSHEKQSSEAAAREILLRGTKSFVRVCAPPLSQRRDCNFPSAPAWRSAVIGDFSTQWSGQHL